MKSANGSHQSDLSSSENSFQDTSAHSHANAHAHAHAHIRTLRPITRRSKMRVNFERKLAKLKALRSKDDVTTYNILGIDRTSSGRVSPPGLPELGSEPQGAREDGYLLKVEELPRLETNNFFTENYIPNTNNIDLTKDLVEKDVRSLGIFSTQDEIEVLPSNDGGQDEEELRDCGFLTFRPVIIQPLAKIKVFMLFMCLLITAHQALISGYSSSVVTTIEKRYGIPSSLIGVISSSTEVGNIVSVLLVSYLGSKRKIPLWIAAGCLLIGVGSFLFVVPQLASERWTVKSEPKWNHSETENICRSNVLPARKTTANFYEEYDQKANYTQQDDYDSVNGFYHSPSDRCIKKHSSNLVPVIIFVLSYILIGVGGSPILTLGCTYVDDHVTKQNSSFYIGILYTMAGFGPVLGFLLGGYLLSFYVDSFFVSKSEYKEMDNKHPRWIGMWWGGFLLFGLIISLLSIPFSMFPKSIKKEKDKLESKTCERSKSRTSNSSRSSAKSIYGKSIKEIPVAMVKLLFNPIFFVTCLGTSFELMIVAGFILFVPKYLETQFAISSVHAAVFTGGIAIPGGCIGILSGGYLMKRYSLGSKGAIRMALICNVICLSLYGSLFALGCKNSKMAGATSSYFSFSDVKTEPVEGVKNRESFVANLTSSCNSDCSCRNNFLEPICGNDGLTYFTPCHAGCTYSDSNTYSNCSCIPNAQTNQTSSNNGGNLELTDMVAEATAGPCSYSSCKNIKGFLAVLFFMTLFVAINQMPLMMVAFRSVKEEERCFALGLRFVIFRMLAYIPAPIIFGTLIDSSCIIWKDNCEGENGGKCVFYDIEKLRFRVIGFCTGIKVLSTLIFLFDWLLIRRKCKVDIGETRTVGDMLNSSVSFSKDEMEYGDKNESFPNSPEQKISLPNSPDQQNSFLNSSEEQKSLSNSQKFIITSRSHSRLSVEEELNENLKLK